MDIDDPLDFEIEDPLLIEPVASKKRKRKLIGLDDLLREHYKEQSKLIEKEAKKKTKAQKIYDSDEDKFGKEAKLSSLLDGCQNQMKEISSEEEMPEWGLYVFRQQKTAPCLSSPKLGSWSILQSFMDDELNSLVGLDAEQDCSFLEGLLRNGWLIKVIFKCGRVEKSIAAWTFFLMLYSSKEELRSSACEFWCSILSTKVQDNPPIEIDWFPSYSELKNALDIYGFSLELSSNISVKNSSVCNGPPQNIITWIKFAAVYCQVRCKQFAFSTSDCQELAEIIICLFLDRRLQGLSFLMSNCMQSVISSFTDEEWINSYSEIAKSLASRVPMDFNCLRAVQCILGVDSRSKNLRSAVAFQVLVNSFDHKANDEEGILNLLISINVKEKACDFFKMYLYLVLSENWLQYDLISRDKPLIREMWGVFLRNCSYKITTTDLRSNASKVRNKAAYLLQGIGNN